MMSAGIALIVIALVFVVISAAKEGPLWPAVLCLILLHLVGR